MKRFGQIISLLLALCLCVGVLPLTHAEETCAHEYDVYGNCIKCGYFCPHQWENGHCGLCSNDCLHDYVDMVCTICGLPCAHAWQDGNCPICGGVCSHSYTAAVTEPDCENGGYTTYTCTCGDSYTADETAPLGHSYENGSCIRCGAEDPNYIPGDIQTATLVTDAAGLAAGDRIIITAAGYQFALSTTQNTNNRGQAPITKDAATAGFGSDTQIITLAAGNREGTFALTVDGQYLYAPSSSSNHLKTTATLSDNASWVIVIDEVGIASITASGTSTRNTLRYNASSSLFSCYAPSNTQKDISIYRIGDPHSHHYETVVTEPTCDNGGYTTYTCTCGHSYTANETAPLGHSYENGSCIRCGTADPDYVPVELPTLKASGFTLSFEDEILVNLYYTVSDTTDIVQQGMLVFYNDPGEADITKATDIYEGSKYVEASNSYINTTRGIAAKEMGDDRYYCAYAKRADGTFLYSPLYQYSPKKYAMSRIQNSTDANMRALCVAMLNYGAAAQRYFGYRTEDLMNAGLTDEQKALVVPYDESYFTGAVAADPGKLGSFAATDSFSAKSASVSFEGAFAINYYFLPNSAMEGDLQLYIWDPNAYAAADVLTVDNASAVIPMAPQSDGAYWGQVTGIAAKALDDTYYVVGVYTDSSGNLCSTGVIAYSLSKYCLNNAKPGKEMQELAGCTAMYGYYADIYFTAR